MRNLLYAVFFLRGAQSRLRPMRNTEKMDPAKIALWLRENGLGGLTVTAMPDIGFVNDVYQVGEDLVLRITKQGGDPCDAYTESVAVPVAVEAELATPELLVFDDSLSTIDAVTTLYRKAEGKTLGRLHVDQKELPALYRELGSQLGRLHRNVKACEDPRGYLDKPEFFDARAKLQAGRQKRKIEAVTYDWISRWLDRLEPAFEIEAEKRFLHDDLHSFNTLVHLDPLLLSAILDWGDAGWGDPALEFGTMPIWAVDWALTGYEEEFKPLEEEFFGRLLWHDIGAAIDATIDEWQETDEPWQPLTTSRWVNLIRHLAHPQDSRWARWLPKDPF